MKTEKTSPTRSSEVKAPCLWGLSPEAFSKSRATLLVLSVVRSEVLDTQAPVKFKNVLESKKIHEIYEDYG